MLLPFFSYIAVFLAASGIQHTSQNR